MGWSLSQPSLGKRQGVYSCLSAIYLTDFVFLTNFAALLSLLLQERLAEEREELERQREKYQQDLERLRESTRAVEKEKERLEHQKKIKRKTIEVGSLNADVIVVIHRYLMIH